MFSTTSGLNLLDITDAFVNSFGIVGAALVSVLVVAAVLGLLDRMVAHLNSVSSFRLGALFKVMVGVVMPIVLAYTFLSDFIAKLNNGYGDFPAWFVNTFGWGMVLSLVVLAVLLSLIPWSKKSNLHQEHLDDDSPFVEHESLNRGRRGRTADRLEPATVSADEGWTEPDADPAHRSDSQKGL